MSHDRQRRFLILNPNWPEGRIESVHVGLIDSHDRHVVMLVHSRPVAERPDGRATAELRAGTPDQVHDQPEVITPLEPDAAGTLLDHYCAHGLSLNRHTFQLAGVDWRVDEFRDMNQGLLLATTTSSAVDSPASRPDWLGEEVTDDPRYHPVGLAHHPFQEWDNSGLQESESAQPFTG